MTFSELELGLGLGLGLGNFIALGLGLQNTSQQEEAFILEIEWRGAAAVQCEREAGAAKDSRVSSEYDSRVRVGVRVPLSVWLCYLQ